MNDRITIDIANHVADVRMVRVDKMNALDAAMFGALNEAAETLEKTEGLRAIVLSGEGKGFCAGLDKDNFASLSAGGNPISDLIPRTHGLANMWQNASLAWRKLPVPVIAAVHGAALGGGFQLMLGADMRYISPDAKLSILEMKWGLIPDMGGIWLTKGLVRPDILAELIYSGRVFTGDDALALGFATRVCADPRSEALSTAAQIAANSPDAVRAAKRLLTIEDETIAGRILKAESDEQQALLASPNQVEAVRAGLAGRIPKFRD